MRKQTLFAALVALTLALPLSAGAATWTFSGGLSAAQETHPLALPAPYFGGGTLAFFLNDVTGELSWLITFAGLTGAPLAAHVHAGPPGIAGPVLIDLGIPTHAIFPAGLFPPSTGDYVGSFMLAPLDAAGAVAGLHLGDVTSMYVNIHTAANPAGEIRGQLIVSSVSAVPVPAAVWLMGSAMLGLVGMRRRTR